MNQLGFLFFILIASPEAIFGNSCASFLEQIQHQQPNHHSSILDNSQFKEILTKEEYLAVLEYKIDSWRINNIQSKFFSRMWSKLNSSYCKECRHLISGLRKLPNYNGIVYRGVLIGFRAKKKYLKKGRVISETRFLSTSRDFNGANHLDGPKAIFFVIKSFSGKSIEELSDSYEKSDDSYIKSLYTNEREVIFLPGTQFIIEEVELQKDGSHRIHMKELEREDLTANKLLYYYY